MSVIQCEWCRGEERFEAGDSGLDARWFDVDGADLCLTCHTARESAIAAAWVARRSATTREGHDPEGVR